ncbi:MAG: hypothetical protein L6V89_04245 [Oscillospiraceae bacterium]|nr:MAG: hypothetical protein L6V89_04245 [Oscillospiraceae bacterium]
MFYDCIRAVLKVLAFVLMPVRVYGRETLTVRGRIFLRAIINRIWMFRV